MKTKTEITYGVLPNGEVPTQKNYYREYMCWRGMLDRCSEENSEKSYYYSVCDERWYCFANFIQDLPLIENYEIWRDNPRRQINLDKDIKCNCKSKDCSNKYEKRYCIENCIFVPSKINLQERRYRPGGSNVPYIVTLNGEEVYKIKNNVNYFAFLFHNNLYTEERYNMMGQEEFTIEDYKFVFDEQTYLEIIREKIEEEIKETFLIDNRAESKEK